jgi:hypothetical protein
MVSTALQVSYGLDRAPGIGWSRLRSTTEGKFGSTTEGKFGSTTEGKFGPTTEAKFGSTTEGGIDSEFLPGLKFCKFWKSCQKKQLG